MVAQSHACSFAVHVLEAEPWPPAHVYAHVYIHVYSCTVEINIINLYISVFVTVSDTHACTGC